MKVKVTRVSDDYVLTVRYTDELLDAGFFADEAELLDAEKHIKERGRWYKSADICLWPT